MNTSDRNRVTRATRRRARRAETARLARQAAWHAEQRAAAKEIEAKYQIYLANEARSHELRAAQDREFKAIAKAHGIRVSFDIDGAFFEPDEHDRIAYFYTGADFTVLGSAGKTVRDVEAALGEVFPFNSWSVTGVTGHFVATAQ